jgi:hypothetical protein
MFLSSAFKTSATRAPKRWGHFRAEVTPREEV